MLVFFVLMKEECIPVTWHLGLLVMTNVTRVKYIETCKCRSVFYIEYNMNHNTFSVKCLHLMPICELLIDEEMHLLGFKYVK